MCEFSMEEVVALRDKGGNERINKSVTLTGTRGGRCDLQPGAWGRLTGVPGHNAEQGALRSN